MLTYLDMTVLTYEIERGVEREDVRSAESSRTAGMAAGTRSTGERETESATASGRPEEEITDDDMLDDSDESEGEDDDE